MEMRIQQRVEDFLNGASPMDADLEQYLAQNQADRDTVHRMKEQASLIREAFRLPVDLAPAPGFYARVMQRIEEQQSPASLWSVFTGAFGRRLVYASAVLIVMLGVAIYGTGDDEETLADLTPDTPAAILVDDQPGVHLVGETTEDRGRVFVSLTAIEQ